MNLIESFANILFKRSLVSAELLPWLIYALQKTAVSCISYFVLIIIGWHFCGLIETLIFLSSFSLLRKYIGGWHAPTPLKCLLFSILCEIICLCYLRIAFQNYSLLTLLMTLISSSIVFLLSPLLPSALNATKNDICGSKKLAQKVLLFLLLSILILIMLKQYNLVVYVSLGISCAALSLMIEKIKRIKHEGIVV